MDSNSVALVAIVFFLVLLSAYFSATETAFSSLNKIRLKNMANNGHRKAQLALFLSEHYDKLLSTILIGNNISNIVLASLSTIIFVRYFGNLGVTLSALMMTIIVLIFGEITPKSLAKETPERFAIFSAPILRFLMVIFTPLNFIFIIWKKFLFAIFHFSKNHSITEEELLMIVEEAQNDGGIGEPEGELIRSAIEFNDLDASDVLTPRVDVVALDVTSPTDEITKLFLESGYSRLPVYRETIDNIIGFIHEKDFHNHVLHGISSLEDILNPVVCATGSTKISTLLKRMQLTKAHVTVITDEYGGTVGIVTLEDILEELVGEIWDEHDEIIEEFVKISDDEYRISCGANLDKMFKLFRLNPKQEFAFSTVSGWVLEELGRIPNEGDRFSYENLDVTVTKTDYKRVLEILVKVRPSTPPN